MDEDRGVYISMAQAAGKTIEVIWGERGEIREFQTADELRAAINIALQEGPVSFSVSVRGLLRLYGVWALDNSRFKKGDVWPPPEI